jgi:hypothetical protein
MLCVSLRAPLLQILRTGSLIDVLTLFAGGPASGPGPGQPGGPSIHAAPRLTVSKPARQEAGAILSAMCSDSKHGPPCVMALSQLIPDALAMSIKDSVSAATSAGAGGATVGSAGTGVGAAGAGGTPSGLGDSVLMFDGDHETPELIWDGTCRCVAAREVVAAAVARLCVCVCLCACVPACLQARAALCPRPDDGRADEVATARR